MLFFVLMLTVFFIYFLFSEHVNTWSLNYPCLSIVLVIILSISNCYYEYRIQVTMTYLLCEHKLNEKYYLLNC